MSLRPGVSEGLVSAAVRSVCAPVDEVVLVDGLQRHDGLRDVETGLFFRERIAAHEEGHHVATGQILHDQVEELVVLEGVEQLHNARVAHLSQQVALGFDVVHLKRRNAVSALSPHELLQSLLRARPRRRQYC